jgi:hypothetical protein
MRALFQMQPGQQGPKKLSSQLRDREPSALRLSAATVIRMRMHRLGTGLQQQVKQTGGKRWNR